MEKDIHPAYAPVVFRDRSADFLMVTASTITSNESVEVDGRTYPVIDVDVSTASHPFWTGRGRVLDNEGRVQRFERRYGARS